MIWIGGWQCSIVKTHTFRWVTHKWENNYNCRGSPQGMKGPRLISGYPVQGSYTQKMSPKNICFEFQQGLL